MATEYYRSADMETRAVSIVHSVALVVGAFVAGTLSYSAVGSLLGALGVQVTPLSAVAPLPYAVLTAAQFVGFFLVVAFYLAFQDGRELFSVDWPSPRDALLVVVGFVGLFAVAAALSAVFRAAGVETATNQVIADGRQDPVRFLYLLPVTFLFVAPAEELLYRGLIQGLFRRAYGVVPAVLLASVLFGAPHYFALLGPGDAKVPTLVLVTVLGIALATLYEVSENLAVPVAVHALWNSFSFVSQYVEATGLFGV